MPPVEILLVISLVLTALSVIVNHVDDTDETYGYWEPLHYLVKGVGFQTWEYSPAFAIRTYSFIYPVKLVVAIIEFFDISGAQLFFATRACFGIMSCFSTAYFTSGIRSRFPGPLFLFVGLLLLLSPGMFFASTAYLPSAVAMNFVMISVGSLLRNHFISCIFWGSVAVLWTGWPFVGVIFLPFGVYMAISTIVNKSSILAVVGFLLTGITIAATVALPTILIDHHFYGKWTYPTLNILLYNAIGGSGDELYGTEPMSYYVRNLLLNMGVAWPLYAIAPFAVAADWAMHGFKLDGAVFLQATLVASGLCWLGILFSRPHKEERFLYPAYPLIAFTAALGMNALCNVGTSAFFFRNVEQDKTKCQEAADPKVKRKLANATVLLCFFAGGVLFCSRIMANYRNYKGYLALWRNADRVIELRSDRPTNVCTGAEWYQFPTHFLLSRPSVAGSTGISVEYVRDGFGGILPQHFGAANGTSAQPLQPFNDRNREEVSRYLPLASCDYLVLLIDRNKPLSSHDELRRGLVGSGGSTYVTLENGQHRKAAIVHEEDVLSSEFSTSSLGRAFYIPGLSEKSVKFKKYVIVKML